MILLAFALLTTGFMYLSYRYTLQEKKSALEEEAGYVARLTARCWIRQLRSPTAIIWPV